MKNLRYILLLAPLLWAFTCDDDPSDDRPAGTWSLIKVNGGMAGTNSEFPEGMITWKFNLNNTVEIINNNLPEINAEYFFDTGTYSYDYVINSNPNSCRKVMQIDNINLGCQHLETSSLTFSQSVAADGYTLTFKRI